MSSNLIFFRLDEVGRLGRRMKKQSKNEKWRLIQEKEPVLAAYIQATAARTGKLKSIRVTFADGSTVEVNNG